VVPGCSLWAQAALPFCHAHAATWRANGRPDVAAFLARFDEVTVTEDQVIRLRGLGPQLRLEVQYALQCRAEHPTTKTSPVVVMQMVRLLAAAEVTSVERVAKS